MDFREYGAKLFYSPRRQVAGERIRIDARISGPGKTDPSLPIRAPRALRPDDAGTGEGCISESVDGACRPFLDGGDLPQDARHLAIER